MSDDLIKRIREKCAGRDRWYVMNAAEDGYCMDFDWGLDADRWMDDRLRENPDYINRNGYHVVKQRSFTSAEELANEAAAALETANARIAALEAQIAAVAPAVDAQPVDLTAAQKWEIAERVHAQCEQLKPHAKPHSIEDGTRRPAQTESLRADSDRAGGCREGAHVAGCVGSG